MTTWPLLEKPVIQLSNVIQLASAKAPQSFSDSQFTLADKMTEASNIWNNDIKAFIDSSGKAIPPRTPRPFRKPIYDESANARQQVDTALEVAKKTHKNVFIEFGNNGCSWCYKLHDLLTTNSELHAELEKSYDFVLIVGNTEQNRKVERQYGNTEHGYPSVSVLDADGKVLVQQDPSTMVETKGPSAEKWLAFLKTWAPK